MTKAEAKILLSDFLDNNPLPIYDVVVLTVNDVDVKEEYTFRGLLKIAYDLEDIGGNFGG